MSYVDPNYKTKKAFLEALANGREHHTYNPSGMRETPQNGTDVIEGPHYPVPHKWYAAVTVKDGIVVKSGKATLGSAKATITAAKADTSVVPVSEPSPVSYAAEVIADNSGKYCGNALRFRTREEATIYARDLMSRWTAVRDYRIVESSDKVTDQIINGVQSRIDGD